MCNMCRSRHCFPAMMTWGTVTGFVYLSERIEVFVLCCLRNVFVS